MDWGMTFFSISCKFFFQILAYLEGKKKSTIVAFIPELSSYLQEHWGIRVSNCDCSVGMSEVTFLLCLGHISRVKQMSAWHCIVCLSIQKLSIMNSIKSSSCKDNTIKVSPKFYKYNPFKITSNYLEFRELLVTVLVYLMKCFNTARSLIYCVKFNLKDECCIWWNLALCYE